ncbi:hypothetical protein JW824_11855 [bacterium]|nr:hypothetical protein [bacterium]
MEAKRVPIFSYLGVFLIITGTLLLILRIQPVTWFYTPVAWTGYILLIDGIVFVRKNHSLLTDRPGQILYMLILSIVCWLIFEAYNVHVQNWHYDGLPGKLWVRWLGYGWSFATIFPGIFETTDLLESFGLFKKVRIKIKTVSQRIRWLLILIGAIFLIAPLFFPTDQAQYMTALIWVGFILLLDPINYRLGARSILYDWEKGEGNKIFYLMLAGLICGFLWELWNFWAEAKWIYDIPIAQDLKVFEMVLPGYLGFLPFAVECYVMYYFCLRIFFGIRSR